jgi:hypothetical protein
MKRRSLLFLGVLSPIALFNSRYLGVKATSSTRPMNLQQCAEQLNQFATTIQTPADARRFVDYLADLFSEDAPSTWTNNFVRSRIAEAEFAAVTDPQKAIPEQRLAEAWNDYVDTLGAPENQKVTPAELHNLRDAFLTTDRFAWNSGYRNIWAVPSIYATRPDGHLAPGCRAVEAIRVIWDLANLPDNLRAARDRVSKGVLTSDLYRKSSQSGGGSSTRGSVSFSVRGPYPIELAQREYIQHNGNKVFSRAVMAVLTKTLS